MSKRLSQCAYRTVYAYGVHNGGARANKDAILGKLMVPNLEYGYPAGPTVFTRAEPADVALFHKTGEFSIDELAEEQWKVDNVEVIQFVDKETGTSYLIHRLHWEKAARPAEHGAGRQRYVRREHFTCHDHVVYDYSHYNPETKWLDPAPPRYWQKIPPPQAPAPKQPRGVRPGQMSLSL